MGEVEIWRDIPELTGFYQASSLGRVRSVRRTHMQKMRDGSIQPVEYGGKVRAVHSNKSNGYLMIALSRPGEKKRTYCVHFLVCSAFHGPRPDGCVVAHGDGNRLNPCADNLRWATSAENAADKIAHGTLLNGERHGNAKLSDADVAQIRTLRASGQRYKAIAVRFGVSWETCRKIHYGVKRPRVTMESARG